ncbi:MAG TPA: STAS domain-containing protein [Solirubrobacteraceae bacterium]|nr:STAS domain-containing protein [Solirubrobacteraceae bacterium]
MASLRVRRIWRLRLGSGAPWVEEGLAVAGEVDLTTADRLRDRLTAALGRHPARLELDLADLEFADSRLVHILVEARAAFPATRLLLTGCRPQLARLLGLCHLADLLAPPPDPDVTGEPPATRLFAA